MQANGNPPWGLGIIINNSNSLRIVLTGGLGLTWWEFTRQIISIVCAEYVIVCQQSNPDLIISQSLMSQSPSALYKNCL